MEPAALAVTEDPADSQQGGQAQQPGAQHAGLPVVAALDCLGGK